MCRTPDPHIWTSIPLLAKAPRNYAGCCVAGFAPGVAKIRKRSRKTAARRLWAAGRKDQRRVIFRFRDGHASDVDLIDYH